MRIRQGPLPGSAADDITRGVVRLMNDLGHAPLLEFRLTNKRRVDVAALDRDGRFTVIEVKSSLADFRADGKWQEYLPYCDFFYFAVNPDFPQDRLPDDVGLIVADTYGAAILRPADEFPMNGNRRRTQTLRFARTGASRLAGRDDPPV
ncbi:MAG: MmcB family DNA repair protein [Rhodospirillales bacterium]|nr:MmcB family DNA repair protein [Rhodospirillales bacterium]MBO6788422.1 MmcB family DNA repair protein [Rhodospirillales bacterium]